MNVAGCRRLRSTPSPSRLLAFGRNAAPRLCTAAAPPQLLRSLAAKRGDRRCIGHSAWTASRRAACRGSGPRRHGQRWPSSRCQPGQPELQAALPARAAAVGDEAKDVISGEGERVERVGVQAAVGAAVCAAVVAALSAATTTAAAPGRVAASASSSSSTSSSPSSTSAASITSGLCRPLPGEALGKPPGAELLR